MDAPINAAMLARHNGIKLSDIAEKIGKSESTLVRWAKQNPQLFKLVFAGYLKSIEG